MTQIIYLGKFWGSFLLFWIFHILGSTIASLASIKLPKIEVQPYNLNVTVGSNVSFTCTIENLSEEYNRVAWIRYENRAMISIGEHMLTLHRRLSVTKSASGNNTWILHIKNVQQNDAGGYLCQVNSERIVSHLGRLNVFDPAIINASSNEKAKLGESSGGIATYWRISASISVPLVIVCVAEEFSPSKISYVL